MDSYYQKKAKKRTFILLSLFLIWLVVIIFRLVRFQIIEYSYFKTKVTAQNQNIEPVIPKRGTIFDRSGVILARSVPRQSVFYIPFKEEPIELQLEKIQKLKTILDLSGREFQIIKQRIEKNKTFIWIKRKIDPEKVKKVKDLAHSGTGIYLREENKRFYPHGDLGSHIIGRVNIDDAGASGIVFPHIKTRQDAEDSVGLLKYFTPDTPNGKRGFEPAYGLPKRDDEKWLVHSMFSYSATRGPQTFFKPVALTKFQPEERKY